MSTTRSSFDQYCISYETISHRAAAAPDPEVRRECPMTKLTALPLLVKILETPLLSKDSNDRQSGLCEWPSDNSNNNISSSSSSSSSGGSK